MKKQTAGRDRLPCAVRLPALRAEFHLRKGYWSADRVSYVSNIVQVSAEVAHHFQTLCLSAGQSFRFAGKGEVADVRQFLDTEQDPDSANPLDYARMARKYVKEQTGL